MSSHLPKTIIAHRGGVVDDQRSENSFKALHEATRRGYTHVEIDARITADSHVVCFHNDELMDEAGVEGNISEMPLAEITNTVLTRSGEKIPTFYNYCAQCADRIGVMVDLKGCSDDFVEPYANEIKTALADHNLLNDALILINKTPQNNQAIIANHFMGKARISWRKSLAVTQLSASEDPDFATKYYIFNQGSDFITQDIHKFQKLGLEVIVSINTEHYKNGNPQQQGEDHIRQLMHSSIDGFQIDSCFDPVIFTN